MNFKVENGCFHYHNSRPLFQNLNFEVSSGEMLMILGPNGVGKTTLLKCLLGFLKWTSGRSVYKNKKGEEYLEADLIQYISYVPQFNSVTFKYSGEEFVLMGRNPKLGPLSLPVKKDLAKVEQIFQEMGIEALKEKSVTTMSGGELKMLYIARALVAEPQLLILDEPEANLDIKNQIVVLNQLVSMVKKKDIGCIINTHYPDYALKIADKTILLSRGRSHIYGQTAEVINENSIREVFGVETRLLELKHQGQVLKTLVTVDINQKGGERFGQGGR